MNSAIGHAKAIEQNLSVIGEKTMARIKKQESPIIQLTHWVLETTLPEKGVKKLPKDGNRTIYGVDTEGNERVYAKVTPKQWEKWSKTDPLWKQARSAMFDYLLSDPSTRDFVIKTNLQYALEKGYNETAIKLWKALSDSTKTELMLKLKAKNNNFSNSEGNSLKRPQLKKNDFSIED
jgi:hypothetical protein